MRYAWARQVGKRTGMPYQHLVLLFSRDAYRDLGNYADLQTPALCNRIRQAWVSAPSLPEEGVNCFPLA